jgi:hypothetical protein
MKNVGVNKNGIAWYKIGEKEYLCKFFIDSKTESTISLKGVSQSTIDKMDVNDFFLRMKNDFDIKTS